MKLDSIHDAMLDAVGVHAGQLGEARALHDRPHAQTDRGVAQHQREHDEHHGAA